MNFLKKHFLKIEISIVVLLILVVVFSFISHQAMISIPAEYGSLGESLEWLWYRLFFIHFAMRNYPIFGYAINIMFYSFLVAIPVIGLLWCGEKKNFKLHVLFMILSSLHFLLFLTFNYTFNFIYSF